MDSHLHIVWTARARLRGEPRLGIHIPSRLRQRNPNKIRHLRLARRCLSLFYALRWMRAGAPSLSDGWQSGFERDIRGEGRRNQGLRSSSILVITPARTGEASRVLHPLRSGASECSANGRSATRSDSQRSNGRTRWDGHPAWGSKTRLYRALPSGVSANRWQVGEEQRQQCHDLG